MESFFIENVAGNSLATYLFKPAEKCSCILIICHGFRGAKENGGKLFPFARRLNAIGIGVLAFDFSGSGASTGSFRDITLTRQAVDLGRVIDYVADNFCEPIILLGRSFGGSTILVGGVADERVGGYIFWSAPINLHETFSAIMAESYLKLADGQAVCLNDEGGSFQLNPDLVKDFDRHDMHAYIMQLGDRPVLIVHGVEDQVVACSNATCLYEGAAKAELHLIPGADHRFTGRIQEREDITLGWLEQLMNPSIFRHVSL